MPRTAVDPSARPHPAARSNAGPSDILIALRLLALAVVTVSAALSPAPGVNTGAIIAGVVASAALAVLQVLELRRRRRLAACLPTVGQLVLTTVLAGATGGTHSPFTALYLLEVPLSGIALGPVGVAIAAIGSVAAIATGIVPAVSGWPARAALTGFVGVAAGLTSWMLAVDRRQRRELAATQAALHLRADDLADELRLLGDYMTGGLVAVDPLGRVTRVNPAACGLLGVDAANVSGRAWQDVLRTSGDDAPVLAESLIEAREVRDLRLLVERTCGTRVGVSAGVFPSRSRAGAQVYVLLDALPDDAAASDPLRSLGEAAANVSHQIRNSLHSLQGLACRLGANPGGAHEVAADFGGALAALGELAEDVLAMSGAAHAEETLALPGIVATATVLASRNDVPIVVHARRDSDVFVRAHRGRLVHALFNLLDNACRATRCGEVVEVTLGDHADDAWVEICDRGPGPAAIDLRVPRPGGGHGLAAARQFLETCGGRIEFLPRDGGGSRCRVRLHRVALPQLAGRA